MQIQIEINTKLIFTTLSDFGFCVKVFHIHLGFNFI
jgi:hypothetical protein